MYKKSTSKLLGFLAITSIIFVTMFSSIKAASANQSASNIQHDRCSHHRRISKFNNKHQIEARGFNFELFGETASYSFQNHYLSLRVDPSPDPVYTASRISEIDTINIPVSQRVKCWQPTENQNIVVEYTIRFEQPQTPSLTENIFLWNAPFGDQSIPLTAFGVTRSPGSGGVYSAVVAQDVVINSDFTIDGYLVQEPMPTWLDPTDWHTIRLTVSQTSVQIEVTQNNVHSFTSVLDVPLPQPPEPTGFEFSVDNEIVPDVFIPITISDQLDISRYKIKLSH